jgi:hypothetical protein
MGSLVLAPPTCSPDQIVTLHPWAASSLLSRVPCLPPVLAVNLVRRPSGHRPGFSGRRALTHRLSENDARYRRRHVSSTAGSPAIPNVGRARSGDPSGRQSRQLNGRPFHPPASERTERRFGTRSGERESARAHGSRCAPTGTYGTPGSAIVRAFEQRSSSARTWPSSTGAFGIPGGPRGTGETPGTRR